MCNQQRHVIVTSGHAAVRVSFSTDAYVYHMNQHVGRQISQPTFLAIIFREMAGQNSLLYSSKERVDIMHVIACRETVSRGVDAIIPFVITGF